MINKKCIIVGGGTVSHVASHLALSAIAYGTAARKITKLMMQLKASGKSHLVTRTFLTKMAFADDNFDKQNGYSLFENNERSKDILKQCAGESHEDLLNLAKSIVDDKQTKIVFWNPAIVDFEGLIDGIEQGKYVHRLSSTTGHKLDLIPLPKILPIFRQLPNSKGIVRKDIFLVAFKTTCGDTKQEMYLKGLALLKSNSANLVLVNDVKTRWNMIITPEEAAYGESDDRDYSLAELVNMAWQRSHLTFTQSTVIDGEPISWNDHLVPESLRTVVNYAITQNAYKPFKNATVGHFACVLPNTNNTEFLTSIRKSNFNDLEKVGLVRVKTDSPDTVLAYGAKPSVGGQSQRQVFNDHKGFDCIVHFHCPLKSDHPDKIITASQKEVECGSHQCGANTSSNLRQFGNLKAVYLDQHGPNIVFNRNIDPQEVIQFIDRNFDLSKKTGGYNLV